MSMNSIFKMRLLLLAVFVGPITPLDAGDAIYSLDFTTQPSGNALPWLKQQGFQFKLGCEALNPRFEKGALVLSTERPEAGVLGITFAKGKQLSGVERLRIVWGVSKFPEGADWERGINRTAIAVMVTFGYERISSGLPFGLFCGAIFYCSIYWSQRNRRQDLHREILEKGWTVYLH
jgi:hypothetical protein